MKTRSQKASEKMQLRTRSVRKPQKLEVYVEIPHPQHPRRRHGSPPPPDQRSASTTVPSQDIMDAQPESPSVVNPPPPSGSPVIVPGAASAPPSASRGPSRPMAPASSPSPPSQPAPAAIFGSPSHPEASASRSVASSAPLAATHAGVSNALPETAPGVPIPPILPRGPPPVPPVWTRPTLPTHPRPLENSNTATESASKNSSTANSVGHGEFHSKQSGDIPRIDFAQIKQNNRFSNGQLARELEHTMRERTPPPPDKLFDDDYLPGSSPPIPNSPTRALPPVSSPVNAQADERDAELIQHEDAIQRLRKFHQKHTGKQVQFASDDQQGSSDDEAHDEYKNGDDLDDHAGDDEREETEDDGEVVSAKAKKKGRSGRTPSTKLAKSSPRSSKRQTPIKKGSKATSVAKPTKSRNKTASKPTKKDEKGQKLSLYADDDDNNNADDPGDPEDDPNAPQYEPNAKKYAHAPGPLSKECLAEVNQLVDKFDAKMNAIGRKYHKSVASLWDAANMSKAGGIRELSTWNAFLAHKTKKEGARASPGETNQDFVARLSTEYQELMQELLGDDWQDPVKRRQIAKEHGWLDFVQEARLEVTKDERENGVKQSTMQRCINEMLKLGRLYYELYGVVLSGALYDLNNHSRSRFFGYGPVYQRVMMSEQVAFTRELKSMSSKLRVAQDQDEEDYSDNMAIREIVNDFHSNPKSIDSLRKIFVQVMNLDIKSATDGGSSKMKYVETIDAGQFPNAREFKSGTLKELLRKRIEYWEALLKRADLRSEEEERMVLEEDMGPRIVSWSDQEKRKAWTDQDTFPLVVDDEGTVLLTVWDVVRLKRQKAKDVDGDGDKEDVGGEDNGALNEDDNSEDEAGVQASEKGKSRAKSAKEKGKQKMTYTPAKGKAKEKVVTNDVESEEDLVPPPPPPPRKSTFLADVHARHNFNNSSPADTSTTSRVKPPKTATQKPGPSKPTIPANSRTRALLAQSSAASGSRGGQGPVVDRSSALPHGSGGHVQKGVKRTNVEIVEEKDGKKKKRKI
ncbi:hypothetical protein K435DRAFT_858403 [Dendrothele bispora CBS 962.96]|uniref:Uncharacterized protein n=1 Tax=Dendrothele bispora (strain CBS 962.96) TaxID=1314807 RepID=A0A4S8M328_DENBC|nr:hypothetical protein K435DRAFT_858403 [Dendrothele bispora CBS 962.96]